MHIYRIGTSSFLAFFFLDSMTYPSFNEVSWKTICGFVTKWFCLEVCVCVREIEDKVGIRPGQINVIT